MDTIIITPEDSFSPADCVLVARSNDTWKCKAHERTIEARCNGSVHLRIAKGFQDTLGYGILLCKYAEKWFLTQILLQNHAQYCLSHVEKQVSIFF